MRRNFAHKAVPRDPEGRWGGRKERARLELIRDIQSQAQRRMLAVLTDSRGERVHCRAVSSPGPNSTAAAE